MKAEPYLLSNTSAYVSSDFSRLTITFSPTQDLPKNIAHNCDEMGCGQEHVLICAVIPDWMRANLKAEIEAKLPKALDESIISKEKFDNLIEEGQELRRLFNKQYPRRHRIT